MNQRNLRADKTCLNCGHRVEEQYCPNCGQENIEVKQPFHYLFANFFENFTSYDSQFWKTIGNLLFSPGTLTKEYIQGKRKQYVPPAKLYIFISFLTFFIVSFIGVNINDKSNVPTHDEVTTKMDSVSNPAFLHREAIIKSVLTHEDSLAIKSVLSEEAIPGNFEENVESLIINGNLSDVSFGDAKNIAAYDSIMEANHSLTRMLFHPLAKKFFELKEHKVPLRDIAKGFTIIFMQMLPKALFIYIPLLAFILWIFHNKKKWWYFDHGVFTLHYFSFLLIVLAIFSIFNLLDPLLGSFAVFNFINSLFVIIATIYSALYFFIAYYRFYSTRTKTSLLTSLIIFIVNGLTFSFMLILLIGISLLLIN